MSKAKAFGKGWHLQSSRHSKARRYGKAGGNYLGLKIKKEKYNEMYSLVDKAGNTRWSGTKKEVKNKKKSVENKSFMQLKKEGVFLRYNGDADKDGVKNIKDCKPLDANRQGWLHDKKASFLKKLEERQEKKRLEEMKKLEDMKEKLSQANITKEEKNLKLAEKRALIEEIEDEKAKTKALQEQNKQIKEELSKNRFDKKLLRKSKAFLQKPSTQEKIKKVSAKIKSELRGVFSNKPQRTRVKHRKHRRNRNKSEKKHSFIFSYR